MPVTRIRWGSRQTQRETYNQTNRYDEYEFQTEAEVNAFLQGVEACDGYLDYDQVDDDEALKEVESACA